MKRTAAIVVGIVLLLLAMYGPWRHPELWLTLDQRGDRLMRHRRFAEAAKVYVDPTRLGTAEYRAGDFKAAASAFARSGTPEATYNQANCLVMLGKYDDAVKAYDRALSLRPDWPEAGDNKSIAIIRRDRLKTTGGDETGGEEKPDDVVFGKGKQHKGETVQADGGAPMNDEQLRALWLRRVQTKPADFLRAKFAFQSQQPSETKSTP
jgi:Ca-activated chloride channel family protein